MKKILYTFGLSLLTSLTFAQMTKDEVKVVAKQMKSQTPEQFVQTAEDLLAAKSQVIELEDKLELVTFERASLDSEVKDYMAATQAAKMRIEQLEDKRHQLATAGAGQKPAPIEGNSKVGNYESKKDSNESDSYGSYQKTKPVSGLLYKVQIGAFKNYDITKYFNRHDNFSGTVDEDGTMRYTLGAFSDYWEADKFKSYLRNMGVNGAWLVAYKDNKRVSMKAAREGNL
tara:strand:+ start:29 stop:715 length:687 start_codon:yes stop_codon:yes gene_type:complete